MVVACWIEVCNSQLSKKDDFDPPQRIQDRRSDQVRHSAFARFPDQLCVEDV
jgi:hypothetical protein